MSGPSAGGPPMGCGGWDTGADAVVAATYGAGAGVVADHCRSLPTAAGGADAPGQRPSGPGAA
ncbi:MAG: hypothetical protein ACRCYU_15235, partial [Nocardioides sp.]